MRPYLVLRGEQLLGIMWGRDKKFQVSMMYELLNHENKISLIKVLYCSPFSSVQLTQAARTNLFTETTDPVAQLSRTYNTKAGHLDCLAPDLPRTEEEEYCN